MNTTSTSTASYTADPTYSNLLSIDERIRDTAPGRATRPTRHRLSSIDFARIVRDDAPGRR